MVTGREPGCVFVGGGEGRSTHGGQQECAVDPGADGYGDFPGKAGRQISCEKLSFVYYRRELFKGDLRNI